MNSSIASPICQEGQSERTFPILAFFPDFSSFPWFFPDFSSLFPDFPSFSQFLTIFSLSRGHSAPLARILATPLKMKHYEAHHSDGYIKSDKFLRTQVGNLFGSIFPDKKTKWHVCYLVSLWYESLCTTFLQMTTNFESVQINIVDIITQTLLTLLTFILQKKIYKSRWFLIGMSYDVNFQFTTWRVFNNNNMVSKIWVGMSTTKLLVKMWTLNAGTPGHIPKRSSLKFVTLHLPFCLFIRKNTPTELPSWVL